VISPFEIMRYIKSNSNDVAKDMYCVSSEIYAEFTPLTFMTTKKEMKDVKREIGKILLALRVLGLAKLEYVPESDYRGIPWLKVPAYRLTERGLKFLEIFGKD